MTALLDCIDLALAPTGSADPVLQHVHLSIGPGWTAIVGPNGAGKSTLLRGLAGLLAPRAGQIRLEGRDLAAMTSRERAVRIAWLAQQAEAGGDLTVRDVVMLGRLPQQGLFGAASAQDHAVVAQAMSDTECADWADRRLVDLSGGERQRALLARALAVQAPVLLLDEPTTHLDAPHQVALVRLMRQLGASRTVVSVLHDLGLALAADRLVVLAHGQVRAVGRRDDPAVHAALREVFGGAIRIERLGDEWLALPDLRLTR
ncbi:ABC transporter ATP-binding protein [Sphaerotilus mobilis]|uniref:Iron complex transport system ATP-binding protein n=1 Tax=Sphaerotilus mobilis TaxID=47994 RepID=A0A4Q7LUX4_9BURK|nr:ABC transporter ATP-binding protein [Sphaerotilus mobilis]RZS58062.1 iron complex transport system ATP-binding protein [Sphaerotilus mobilis]